MVFETIASTIPPTRLRSMLPIYCLMSPVDWRTGPCSSRCLLRGSPLWRQVTVCGSHMVNRIPHIMDSKRIGRTGYSRRASRHEYHLLTFGTASSVKHCAINLQRHLIGMRRLRYWECLHAPGEGQLRLDDGVRRDRHNRDARPIPAHPTGGISAGGECHQITRVNIYG